MVKNNHHFMLKLHGSGVWKVQGTAHLCFRWSLGCDRSNFWLWLDELIRAVCLGPWLCLLGAFLISSPHHVFRNRNVQLGFFTSNRLAGAVRISLCTALHGASLGFLTAWWAWVVGLLTRWLISARLLLTSLQRSVNITPATFFWSTR